MFFSNNQKTKGNTNGNGTGQIKLVVEYDYQGKRQKVVDMFPASAYKDWSIVRKYLEKKLGTFQFSLMSVYEY